MKGAYFYYTMKNLTILLKGIEYISYNYIYKVKQNINILINE